MLILPCVFFWLGSSVISASLKESRPQARSADTHAHLPASEIIKSKQYHNCT